jgi:hypothetical protein
MADRQDPVSLHARRLHSDDPRTSGWNDLDSIWATRDRTFRGKRGTRWKSGKPAKTAAFPLSHRDDGPTMYRKRSCRLLLRTFFDWGSEADYPVFVSSGYRTTPSEALGRVEIHSPPLSRIRSGFQFTEFTKAWKRVSAPFENLWLEHQMVLVGFGFTDVALGQTAEEVSREISVVDRRFRDDSSGSKSVNNLAKILSSSARSGKPSKRSRSPWNFCITVSSIVASSAKLSFP